MTDTSSPWPTELRYSKSERVLHIVFDNEDAFDLPAELLRVESPSAEVKGHGPNQKTLVRGKEDVTILRIEPVGRYAVRLVFDDGHNTGLYSWVYLHQLGREKDQLLTTYRQAVEASA